MGYLKAFNVATFGAALIIIVLLLCSCTAQVSSAQITHDVAAHHCQAEATYVVTTPEPEVNPGIEGACKAAPDAKGIVREESGGLAPVWCCK
jgi:hypothetical protein